jgi:hypothetical protein
MVRTIIATFALASLIGCAAPAVIDESPEPRPSEPHVADRPSPVEPIALGGCGGERVANLGGPSVVHDLVAGSGKLAWIGESGVHVLDLASQFVELHNEPARHVAAFDGNLTWSTSAVAMNATDVAYVNRSEGSASGLVRVHRSTGATTELANGALSDAVALDASNVWYGVQSTTDVGTSTAFRRMSLGGSDFVEYEALPGVAIKMSANSLHAVALLDGVVPILADLSPSSDAPRVLFQGKIRDFAAIESDVYFTMGASIVRADAGGNIEYVLGSSCEVGAIAATKDSVYFTAWNEEGGAIFRVRRD